MISEINGQVMRGQDSVTVISIKLQQFRYGNDRTLQYWNKKVKDRCERPYGNGTTMWEGNGLQLFITFIKNKEENQKDNELSGGREFG